MNFVLKMGKQDEFFTNLGFDSEPPFSEGCFLHALEGHSQIHKLMTTLPSPMPKVMNRAEQKFVFSISNFAFPRKRSCKAFGMNSRVTSPRWEGFCISTFFATFFWVKNLLLVSCCRLSFFEAGFDDIQWGLGGQLPI